MTGTIGPVPDRTDQQQLAQHLVGAARVEGTELVGSRWMLTEMTKPELETILEAEMSDHQVYNAHDATGPEETNSRYDTRTKTMLTETGPVQIKDTA